MAVEINTGAEVVATDGPLGQIITVVPERDRPDELAFLVVQRSPGMLLTIPADTIEQVPSPDVVRLNASVDLAIELDRARRTRPHPDNPQPDFDLVEGVRAIREEQE